MEIRVLIADDHSIVRLGLGALIKQLDISEVDEVANCADLMAQLNTETYSHLILDLIMPDGNALEIIENINRLYPDLSILIHSMQPIEVYGKILKHFDRDNNPFSKLAVRELEVLHYLLNGYRTKEISAILGLKMNTISTIKAVIFYKVEAENFTHLLQLAHVHQISY